MKNLIITILGQIGIIYSVYSFSVPEECKSFICNIEKALKIIIIFICVVFILYCICDYFINRPFRRFSLNKKQDINKFLVDKIKKTGSVAIFSRDFTWVEKNTEQYILLKDKAKRGELFIFLENETDISKDLSSNGATVKVYKKYIRKGFEPKSRFTILNYKGTGKTTLIGASDDEKHTIYTLKSKDNTELHTLVEEYVKLLDLVCAEPKKGD